jgi:uncharacterized protein YraI
MPPKRVIFGVLLTFIFLIPVFILATGPVEAQITGTNWIGQFYNNTNLQGTPVQANVLYPTGLNFNWGQGPARDGQGNPLNVGPDNFSAVFTSTQTFSQLGTYRFTVRFNDGVRIFINNQVVLDQFGDVTDDSIPNNVTERIFNYDILSSTATFRVEFVEFTGDAILQVQWGFVGAGGVGTPPPAFTPTPAPIATGTVFNVRGLAVRTGPFLGASLITVARPGNAYPIVAKNFEEGLFPWYKIRVGDNIGWASGRYLQPSGNLDAIPTEGSVFNNINPPGDLPPALNVIGTTRAVMNLRVRPSERVQILDKIPWGAQVRVIGRTIQGYNNFWLQVEWNGQLGWIYAPFVGLTGVVDAVPIR